MPLDAICLSGVREELSRSLSGAKIDKVQQPEKDIIILSIRSQDGNRRLLISAAPDTARIHLTDGHYENPQSPPSFCMLLRKHIQGARITGFGQPLMERILTIDLTAYDEIGVSAEKKLIVELIGRVPNIILVGNDGVIIDSIRRVGADITAKRLIQPGSIYRYPDGPAEKLPFFALDEGGFREKLKSAPADSDIGWWMLTSFFGLSPLICRELCHRAFGGERRFSELGEGGSDALTAELISLRKLAESNGFTPYMLMEGDSPKDFSFMPITQYGTALSGRTFESFSSLFEEFYSRRERRRNMNRRSAGLTKSVKTSRGQVERKLLNQRVELTATRDRESLRKSGDLITANIYRLDRGQSSFEAEDYFEEGAPAISVKLDPLLTPAQNAKLYYKKYNKAKTAERYLTALIEEGESRLSYLESVLEELERAESERDLEEIRSELESAGFVKKQRKGKSAKQQKLLPHKFVSSVGLEILVGKNNSQNDLLTTKIAKKSDFWLHTQKVHGSHVILVCNDGEPDETSLYEAACIAAYYSQARDGGKTAVDCAMVRYVKKPAGALPGKVIYTNYKTIIAQADETVVAACAARGQ